MNDEFFDSLVFVGQVFDRDSAWMIVRFRCDEFTLQAPRAALKHVVDIEQYDADVDMLENPPGYRDDAVLATLDTLQRQVLGHFAERICELAPVPRELRTLQDAADCGKYSLLLRGEGDGGAEVLERARGPWCDLWPIDRAELEIRRDVSSVRADEVVLRNRSVPVTMLIGEARLTDDDLQGRSVFFKPAENGKTAGFRRALSVYAKLISRDGEDLREVPIPALLAVVTSTNGNDVLGFLTEWLDATVLARAFQRNDAQILLWKVQVRESLAFLHERGVIWGDINAHNILIDTQDQAWIVDFSGGCSTAAELECSEENKKRELEALEALFA